MTLQEIGKIIQEQRKLYGLTPVQLSDLTGISVTVIKNVEAGKRNATFKSLDTILDAIGLELTVTRK